MEVFDINGQIISPLAGKRCTLQATASLTARAAQAATANVLQTSTA
jgi:hypothetical protein